MYWVIAIWLKATTEFWFISWCQAWRGILRGELQSSVFTIDEKQRPPKDLNVLRYICTLEVSKI